MKCSFNFLKWRLHWLLKWLRLFGFGLTSDPDSDRSVPSPVDSAAIARQSKSGDDIIRSATFPAAHAPSPDDGSRSEGERWPCSLAALGTVGPWRRACSVWCSSSSSPDAALTLQRIPLLATSRSTPLLCTAKALRHFCCCVSFSAWGGISFIFCSTAAHGDALETLQRGAGPDKHTYGGGRRGGLIWLSLCAGLF